MSSVDRYVNKILQDMYNFTMHDSTHKQSIYLFWDRWLCKQNVRISISIIDLYRLKYARKYNYVTLHFYWSQSTAY